jgi:hypothetical protein
MVEGTQILRIDFGDPDGPDENLRAVSWDEFFRVFDQRGLESVHLVDIDPREVKKTDVTALEHRGRG